MHIRPCRFLAAVALSLIAGVATAGGPSEESAIPVFGRDTILVYKIQNLDYNANLVVRLAQFLPDRYLEWEDDVSQGTVFMPGRDLEAAKGFINSSLFKPGSDTRGAGATTLWMSKDIFRDLKSKGKTKCAINGVTGLFTLLGKDRLEVQVNRSALMLPVIKVMDDRMEERWFLDQQDNPLMLYHRYRQFSQTLESITTNRTNTLRWIRGRRLENPPK